MSTIIYVKINMDDKNIEKYVKTVFYLFFYL